MKKVIGIGETVWDVFPSGKRLGGAPVNFSFFAKEVPGLFVFLGVTPRDQDMSKAAPNHNPGFFVDESALVVGVRTLASLATDYLYTNTH